MADRIRNTASDPIHDSPRAATTLLGGAEAGVIGGLLMAAFLMVYAAVVLGNVMAPVFMWAATLGGPATVSGAGATGPILWGVLVHLFTSAALGAIFGVMVGSRISTGSTLIWGAVYGLAVLLVMTFLVLPWANLTMYVGVQQLTGAWVIAHIVFGVGVALAPAFSRRMAPRPA